ncbi:MAG: hypothetical protein JO241_04085, partial [Candidatus Eremiobacteraeota bacterium]|nr:hypothetical protein [Candidatus Eremiobacteraeota bacterium]
MTPTHGSSLVSDSRLATHEAGTIAYAEPAVPRVPVVLSDFERVQLTEPCEQDELKRIQVHFMTLAQAAKRGLKTDRERDELGRTIAERMARFGTSSQYIATRQVCVLSSNFV